MWSIWWGLGGAEGRFNGQPKLSINDVRNPNIISKTAVIGEQGDFTSSPGTVLICVGYFHFHSD